MKMKEILETIEDTKIIVGCYIFYHFHADIITEKPEFLMILLISKGYER